MSRAVYHGTTREYYDQVVDQFGVYRHLEGKRIFVGDREMASYWARLYSRMFNASAIVLEIEVTAAKNLGRRNGDKFDTCDEFSVEGSRFVLLTD